MSVWTWRQVLRKYLELSTVPVLVFVTTDLCASIVQGQRKSPHVSGVVTSQVRPNDATGPKGLQGAYSDMSIAVLHSCLH